ncbi:MAG: lytic murein transglycosylase [Rickettsiales bacterium]|nr:lytic murein transglycosylase [Rickettsiales bacterium]
MPLFFYTVAASAKYLSLEDKAAYKRAFKHADNGNWRASQREVKKVKHRLPIKALEWMRICDNKTELTFREIVTFINANPHWPYQIKMSRRAEAEITKKTSTEDVLRWFGAREPLTGSGAYHLTRILLAERRFDEAKDVARLAWVNLNMKRTIETQFRRQYSKLLRPEDHIARLNRLLWDRRAKGAKRQLRQMSHEYQSLGLARIALMKRQPGVDYAISKVPRSLIDDPGLVYERIRWRRKNQLYETAIELLEQIDKPVKAAKKWWIERRLLTRWLLGKERKQKAYDLVRAHGHISGLPMAEAEWLSGWIALRGLHKYSEAFDHFKRMFENVSFPVSKARAAYWAGRAAEFGGKIEISQRWYALAARHVTSFYGQLAATELPAAQQPNFPTEPRPSINERTAFAKLELVRLIRMLGQIGRGSRIDPFLRQLARQSPTPITLALIADLATDLKRQDLAIHVSKRALREGVFLSQLGYPDLGKTLNDAPDQAFVQAVIRQESAFDPKAISRAGARGLMQLMPGTAIRIARKLNISYSRVRLTRDPGYNVKIGRAYLHQMLEEYNGSPVLALAAYNAGPARVNRWRKKFGDPNRSAEHTIDWIESIPFYETRNYVQRVLENFTVYRGRGSGKGLSLDLSAPIEQGLYATNP